MSKNARLKIALTRTIVNFFVSEDLCADEISIQGTLCITADKSTIFVTQIAETIVDPISKTSQDNSSSTGSGSHGSDFSNHAVSHGNRRESSSGRHSFDGRNMRRDGGGDGGLSFNSSAAGGCNRRLSNHDNSEKEGPASHHGNKPVHPLQHLQARDPHRNVLGECI